MEEENEIAQCPFCGCSEIGKYGVEVVNSYMYTGQGVCLYDYWYVGCHKCNAKSGNYKTMKEAISAWNKRVW